MSFLYDRNQQLFTSRNQVEKKVKRYFLIGLFKANGRMTVCFIFTMYSICWQIPAEDEDVSAG